MTLQEDKIIRVGCASAFWGDTGYAAKQLIEQGHLDYLVFDYLAEMTMSIMAGAQLKNPDAGYAADFITTMKPLLSSISEQGVKVCSNAGGINAYACAHAMQALVKDLNLSLKVAVVEGDNLTSRQQTFVEQSKTEMFSGQIIPAQLTSVNVYLGAKAITEALADGADIVITGRVVDSAVIVGPLMHEFSWSWQNYDLLAQASLAGHVIECGTQCTGGNFTDWHLVKSGYANMGFPIVECHADGRFVVSKVKNTGGLVNCDTVGEQVLYEIGDPCAYLLPDVICNFSQINLQQIGQDQVLVTGAKGTAPSPFYKVSATYLNGFRSTATFMIAGREAVDKGQVVANAIIKRVNTLYQARGLAHFTDVNIEILGSESTYGDNSRGLNSREVIVKISVSHDDRRALTLFGLEIAQAATAMAPGITGIIGGRPKPTPRICLFSFLLEKSEVAVSYQLLTTDSSAADAEIYEGIKHPVVIDSGSVQASETTCISNKVHVVVLDESATSVPLIDLALARSGDKGNHCNVGVIARHKTFLPYIEAALTPDRISHYLSHLLASDSRIHCYQLPGMQALNILIENSLGGGGMASLRIDPQGKAIAQQLLDMPIAINKNLLVNISPVEQVQAKESRSCQ
ncbi:acyclic terpene utilization AtuA family protein [Shewanella surugensis]|uniref:DUF1446 domain-containing protein n=1 Tax=Shewanella surugensis TaxID=212020 RepID=A0ABT0LDF4_9GAMM|nr:acyclic terpene utilization AtuA family protein [Shewanella surugensis]MCL1125714.1 DUF1446 domain-containing protein [Shewanella surugensis]